MKALLAAKRREARAMRRQRDRLLKRKTHMMEKFIQHGFFSQEKEARGALERLNPHELRARGLSFALQPGEFTRALFHLNQRRGFESNRETDKNDKDSGALKTATNRVRQELKDRVAIPWANGCGNACRMVKACVRIIAKAESPH